MVPYESGLERDFCHLLEFDESVVGYEAQPVRLDYTRPGGRRCRGFPDFLVLFRPEADRPPALYDVKPRSKLQERWTELRPRLKAACAYARGKGWIYRLVSEIEIRTPFLANAKFLYRFLHMDPDPACEAAFLRMITVLKRTTPEALLKDCFSTKAGRAAALPTLWNMIATKRIGADLNRSLTMRIDIWEVVAP